MFEPLTVKGMTVKNRVVMTPMGTNYGGAGGEMTDTHIQYYERRAMGGTGLIIVENIGIDFPLGSNGTTQIRIDQDCYLPQLYKLCERVHRHGACIAVQINHAGASAMSSRIGMQPVSASDVPSKTGGEKPRPLTREEIDAIISKFGQAARRAQIAGFDCIELHAGHSYLISQFLSPLTNKRTDEFGGSTENRARLPRLVLEEIRSQVGEMYPIIMRVSADEFLAGGNTLEDTLEYLQYLEPYVDILDVSAALNDSIHYQIDSAYLEDGWRSYMAKAVKERYGKPCITTGNIRDPRVAEQILSEGDADLIGMGRGLLAEPEWVNKVQLGREDRLNKCISCNVGCAGHRIGLNRPMRCTVNPDTIGADEYMGSVGGACNVVVIGGGTAGMEAACTAAEAGCSAFIIEKREQLGGLAADISQLPAKKRINDFPEYLKRRADSLKNLYTFTGTEAGTAFIDSLKPDIIVNATGSTPLLPPIKGLADNVDKEGSRVRSITALLAHSGDYPEDMKGKRVVVIGGGAVGLDVVEFFAPKGADISMVEMLPFIGNGLDPITKVDMTTMMQKHAVRQLTQTKLLEVKNNCFVVEDKEGNQEELPFDYGFVCLGMKAYAPLLADLSEHYNDNPNVEILNIGDSHRARKIIDGTAEGRHNLLAALRKRGYIIL